MDLRKLDDIDINGKSVFLRLDLNVPLKDGVIQDDTRIQKALPTVRYILERTNKLAIASHDCTIKSGKGDKKERD